VCARVCVCVCVCVCVSVCVWGGGNKSVDSHDMVKNPKLSEFKL